MRKRRSLVSTGRIKPPNFWNCCQELREGDHSFPPDQACSSDAPKDTVYRGQLLSLAVERKVLRSRRLRVDTTIVEADIRSPTDSGLCAHAVSRLTRLAKRVKAAGLAPRCRLRDRRRSVGKRVRAISAARVRGRHALGTLDRLTAEIARARQADRARSAHARAQRA